MHPGLVVYFNLLCIECNLVRPVTHAIFVCVCVFQVQAQFVERRTHEEFEKLHAFLHAEEEARMQALRAEAEQGRQDMEKKIEDINQDLASLSESIRALEEDLALEGMSVLHVSLEICSRACIPA